LGEGGKEETSNSLVNGDEFVECRADGSALHWKCGGEEMVEERAFDVWLLQSLRIGGMGRDMSPQLGSWLRCKHVKGAGTVMDLGECSALVSLNLNLTTYRDVISALLDRACGTFAGGRWGMACMGQVSRAVGAHGESGPPLAKFLLRTSIGECRLEASTFPQFKLKVGELGM
jgi:hypothetical protein